MNETIKKLFKDENIINAFANIEGFTGITEAAEELKQNPITENAVIDNQHIVPEKLVAIDTAVLAEVCKRLIAIEARLDAIESKDVEVK